MISYGKQYIDQEDIAAVVETLKGDWLTQGPKVEEFENALKEKFGAKYCCAVANGTAALHLTGLSLGWGPGDIVITAPITFLSTANSIVYAGATPEFVDIDPTTYTVDTSKLEEKIKTYNSRGKNIKAIIGIDYAGHPCDWEALRTIGDKYKLQVINDNCHAIGASFKENYQYATKYADVAVQSYHPVKHITTGEGGSVLTNIGMIDQKVRLLRSHGIERDEKKKGGQNGSWYYEMHEVGFNYRISDFQCSLGKSQLEKLDYFVKKRGEVAMCYDAAFGNDDRFTIPAVSDRVEHAYHLYPLQVKFDEVRVSKKDFFEYMKSVGISLQVHYIPVHLQPYYMKNFGFKPGDFPIAERFYENEISIPIFPQLKSSEIEFVVTRICDYFE
jgi:UDP-4-amino-4,6-dideoxy-N-acetyl-beta-L-altrosamine transaminase